MAIIHAVYENGVFRPTEPMHPPEASEVEIELRRVEEIAHRDHLGAVYALLGARFESGEAEVAARHDEHQS